MSGIFWEGNIYLGSDSLPETDIEICRVPMKADWDYLIFTFTTGGDDGYNHSIIVPKCPFFLLPLYPFGYITTNDSPQSIGYAKCHLSDDKLYFDFRVNGYHVRKVSWMCVNKTS